MTKTDLDFSLKQNIILDLNSFIINLIVATILSIIIQLFYVKYSSTFSNKFEFSKNFVVLASSMTSLLN